MSQCSDDSSAASTNMSSSAVSEPQPTTMSTEDDCRTEPDSEHNGLDSEHNCDLADLVAAMNVAANRVTPPNGYRSGTSRSTSAQRARFSDRKLSLQERGSRMARQPTIETKRVSITDLDVRRFHVVLSLSSFIHPTHQLSDISLILLSVVFLQECVQLNQYKLKKEIGKVIHQNCSSHWDRHDDWEFIKLLFLLCRAHME